MERRLLCRMLSRRTMTTMNRITRIMFCVVKERKYAATAVIVMVLTNGYEVPLCIMKVLRTCIIITMLQLKMEL